MTRYRKRGTEVDAFRWLGVHFPPVWFAEAVSLDKARIRGESDLRQVLLDPPSGKGNPLVANVGDWIVRNGRGEVFPMTAEKFAETYEAVDDRSGRERILALLTDAFGDDGDFFVRDVRAAFDGEKIR